MMDYRMRDELGNQRENDESYPTGSQRNATQSVYHITADINRCKTDLTGFLEELLQCFGIGKRLCVVTAKKSFFSRPFCSD